MFDGENEKMARRIKKQTKSLIPLSNFKNRIGGAAVAMCILGSWVHLYPGYGLPHDTSRPIQESFEWSNVGFTVVHMSHLVFRS